MAAKTATIPLICFALITETLWAAGEATVELRRDEDYAYASDGMDGPAMQLHIDPQAGVSGGTVIRFGRLGERIRGEGVKVLEARLELYYFDELWTEIVYQVAASESLDDSLLHIASQPVAVAEVLGDKFPPDKKTRRPSWVSLPLAPELVGRWIADDRQNRGLVLHVAKAKRPGDGQWGGLKLVERPSGAAFVGFKSCQAAADERPRLVVRYRVTGNAAPSPPKVARLPALGKIATETVLSWETSTDPDGDVVHYEFEVGSFKEEGTPAWTKATAQIEGTTARWAAAKDCQRLYPDSRAEAEKRLWFRVRAVDARGMAGAWTERGPLLVTDRPWSVWGLHGNRKVWPDAQPPADYAGGVKIGAARNEWEPFQVAVAAHTDLNGLTLEATPLKGERATIPAPTLYREHYLEIGETANQRYGRTGLVPDALVPLTHPLTGKPTGGKYGGASFHVPAGRSQGFWADVFVGRDVPLGVYRGSVTVKAEGQPPAQIPVELEVYNFALPAVKHLVGCFELDPASVYSSHRARPRSTAGSEGRNSDEPLMRLYEEMLHEHYINNWSPMTGWNYTLNRVKVNVRDGRVAVDWTEYDRTVGPAMDGTLYRDEVPAQWLFVPYWLPVKRADGKGYADRVNGTNYRNMELGLFAQFIREVQRHFEEKGWLDRAYFFYFDEPFLQAWKYQAFIEVGKVVRREAPKLKIMISDGYRGPEGYQGQSHITEPIEKYVDVWDPVTFQVSSPALADYYRARKRQGKFDVWCQTLGNANARRAIVNLFPDYDMPFHRAWGVLSWSMGFQGIEWWATIVWYNERTRKALDPWTDPTAFPAFNLPLNCDGRLFYPGSEGDIGGPDIPISCLRMKALREAIEDYEYFHLLAQAGLEKQFDFNRLHTQDEGKAKAMKQPMPMGRRAPPPGFQGQDPGPWHWWEGDPDTIMAARQEIARLLSVKP